jgi:glutathione synthase/RimK-type ligase-like ATP-grasp enzyme
MTPTVLFLTDFAFRLYQQRTWRVGYDLTKIFTRLRAADIFPVVAHYEDPNLVDLIRGLNIHYCVPGSSRKKGYRELVNSTLPLLNQMGVQLLPRLELVQTFENKILQVQLDHYYHLGMPTSYAVSTAEAFEKYGALLGYPFVLKENIGFRSDGVSLVHNAAELAAAKRRYFSETATGSQGIGAMVLQQFIPDLKGDWKILCFGNAYSASFRRVRMNDFRASGSGFLDFPEVPHSLLDFARGIKNKLDTPWLSFDVSEKDGQYQLLEYTPLHFSVGVITLASFHYVYQDGWHKIPGPMDLEDKLAEAIIETIHPPV